METNWKTFQSTSFNFPFPSLSFLRFSFLFSFSYSSETYKQICWRWQALSFNEIDFSDVCFQHKLIVQSWNLNLPIQMQFNLPIPTTLFSINSHLIHFRHSSITHPSPHILILDYGITHQHFVRNVHHHQHWDRYRHWYMKMNEYSSEYSLLMFPS